ncbi:MAG: sugar ABC transporter permease [Clostridia bacterium]|nr:sugar ABC transporter permease [Clostridia bacterium]
MAIISNADKKEIRATDRKLLKKKFQNNWDCYLYIAPYGLIFFCFTVLPVLASMVLSFTYYNVLEFPTFIGWDNYRNLLGNDDIFITAVKNTLILAVVTGPVGYIMSVMFAWLINELGPRTRGIMVTILYAPSISGGAYTIFNILFSGDSYGWVNGTLMNLGVIDEPIQFMTDTKYMIWICMVVVVWMSLGTGFLSNVAGFRTIDRSQYEAGYVEGIRNRWQELWFITLPSMLPQLMFSAVMSITHAFSIGAVTTTLFGNPSTDYAAHTILNHIEDYGGVRFDMGYACAIATVLFAMMVASNEIIQKALRKVGQ